MLRTTIKIWRLKAAIRKNLEIADYLLWLRDSVSFDQGTLEDILKEKDDLRTEADAHKRAAKRIMKILNKYHADKSF
jgi:hypothetical protein